MPNHFFQFKQFTIHQDKCAMKVCTDACMFGALVPDGVFSNILDIGTGTGLLSLMVAQKNKTSHIDAVEIDEAAAQQAKDNFEASPWYKRLQVFNADILEFKTDKKYELIIVNPPFFENSLRPAEAAKNKAKHETSFSLSGLLDAISIHLIDDGIFGVLLPANRADYFEKLCAERDFHLFRKIRVKQSPIHDHFRAILFFSAEKKDLWSTEIIITDGDGRYSQVFTNLLKDYYLNL